MRHFPVFVDLTGRPVLVVGAGELAELKAEPLRQAGATVRLRPTFAAADLDGCSLAVGADAPGADLQALSETARARGIPVNVVDRPELCTFIMPAIVDRDPVTIAISTAGTSPVLARLLRAKIEAVVPPAFGRLAALAGRFSSEIRRRVPDIGPRRRMIERILTGRVAELVFASRDEAAEAALRAELETGEPRAGMVFLVGAGPGAGDLLTLRAQRLLGEADVVVHDRLVGEEVLAMARRDTEQIFVGKARANHCMKQEEINALLIRLARAGKHVVRLKGGDPLVFGRGGEEAEALARAGVDFEIVPGITAALACAADAKIPLTHRAASRSVTLATGHTETGDLSLDFEALARPGGTLAIYMGIVTLPRLALKLAEHGFDAATPAALIERGGTRHRRVLAGRFADIVAQAPDWSHGHPTLVLIGDVVARGTEREFPTAETKRGHVCAPMAR
ncbi:MAG TPA: siroheme synthase CysG [Acetobacteraceae bacterium]|jgi:uroporphyrin-III C-methyltransferase/precorrin-2 dehydrogenase/sirohydrochlorin ferrochelatase|nr:siroheme synthase CysG [Acetobacteraceae bacterium]